MDIDGLSDDRLVPLICAYSYLYMYVWRITDFVAAPLYFRM